ncbi:hypothetical protein CEXT_337601 [Caerostris extrusa]|uniref:Uncharacterized protein n=1 Tax=Caerostris extrusa TaxID=172846 RepID=A0AAV4QI67_CAEEX|nr:hypothetical protein CEXT_337601 [Caerostris extrusa]
MLRKTVYTRWRSRGHRKTIRRESTFPHRSLHCDTLRLRKKKAEWIPEKREEKYQKDKNSRQIKEEKKKKKNCGVSAWKRKRDIIAAPSIKLEKDGIVPVNRLRPFLNCNGIYCIKTQNLNSSARFLADCHPRRSL